VQQRAGQLGKAGQQIAAGRGDELDADVVGAGGEMLCDPRADLGRAAVCDESVDQSIAAATGQVLLVEPEPKPVVRVVLSLR
jgi:hypothetical protein